MLENILIGIGIYYKSIKSLIKSYLKQKKRKKKHCEKTSWHTEERGNLLLLK